MQILYAPHLVMIRWHLRDACFDKSRCDWKSNLEKQKNFPYKPVLYKQMVALSTPQPVPTTAEMVLEMYEISCYNCNIQILLSRGDESIYIREHPVSVLHCFYHVTPVICHCEWHESEHEVPGVVHCVSTDLQSDATKALQEGRKSLNFILLHPLLPWKLVGGILPLCSHLIIPPTIDQTPPLNPPNNKFNLWLFQLLDSSCLAD